MRHVGHLDDHASARRDPQRSRHPREIRGASTGAGIGQVTGAGI